MKHFRTLAALLALAVFVGCTGDSSTPVAPGAPSFGAATPSDTTSTKTTTTTTTTTTTSTTPPPDTTGTCVTDCNGGGHGSGT